MKYNKVTRRMFLQGTGTLLSIPLLESLVPKYARAQAAEPIKRYINYTMNWDYGSNRNWFPKLTTLSSPLSIPGNPNPGSYDRLSTLIQGKAELSRIINSAFNPFLDQMMLYKGLDVPTHGFHSRNEPQLGSMWLAGEGSLNGETPKYNRATETINHILARNSKFDPSGRAAIHLGTWGGGWKKDALGVVKAHGSIAYNPWDAYKILFDNGNYPESGQLISNPRKDVLSRVLEDYQRIISGKKIGASDKIVLTDAMDSIADLQRSLEGQAVNGCVHKGQDSNPANNKNISNLDDPNTHRNWTKLAMALFQCDITRVITIGFSAQNIDDWTGLPTQDFHENITHKNQEIFFGKPNWLRTGELHGRHFRDVLAPFIEQLNTSIDPANGKSFLHNGLMHVSFESNEAHRQANLPTLTFGSINGALPTGYMVNYSDPTRPFTFGGGTINGGGGWSDDPKDATDPATDNHSYDYPGIPYQRFLVTLLQAMGLSPNDYEDPNLNKHLLNRNDSLYGPQNNGITHVGGVGICSIDRVDLLVDGHKYHHDGRLSRYNYHYYKNPIPLPPKV